VGEAMTANREETGQPNAPGKNARRPAGPFPQRGHPPTRKGPRRRSPRPENTGPVHGSVSTEPRDQGRPVLQHAAAAPDHEPRPAPAPASLLIGGPSPRRRLRRARPHQRPASPPPEAAFLEPHAADDGGRSNEWDISRAAHHVAGFWRTGKAKKHQQVPGSGSIKGPRPRSSGGLTRPLPAHQVPLGEGHPA